MSDLLDLELSHHLRPVEAPAELWGRIVDARRPRARGLSLFALPVAAVMTLVLAGALFVIARGQPSPERYRVVDPTAECMRCHT
jgi:hypothetical protein